jgi:acetyl esterase/lipase
MPEPATPGVLLERGIAYPTPEGFRPLELDLYRPATQAAPLPVIVLIHGGGWRKGDRSSFGPVLDRLSPTLFERLARAGFLVASVDYRLSGEAVFPAQLDDVVEAVGFLRARAQELGADADRLVLWGESAGGHLAALAALQLRASDGTSAIAGVVDWYGPSDLAAMPADRAPDSVVDHAAPDSRESLLLGCPLLEAGVLATAASPALLAHPAAPPFHLAHGTADRFVPTRQSLRLRDALQEHGVPVELVLVEGSDHVWIDAPDVEQIIDAATNFARKVTTR